MLKTQFYSDVTKQTYDSEEAANAAEVEFKAKEDEEARKKRDVSKRKKKLSDTIEDCKKEYYKAVDNARNVHQNYQNAVTAAEAEARKLISNVKETEGKYVTEAEDKVSDAYSKYRTAVANFNKEFGIYKIELTGNDVWEEFDRLLNQFRLSRFF